MLVTFSVHFQVSLAAPKLHQFPPQYKTKIEPIRFKVSNRLESAYYFAKMNANSWDSVETVKKELTEFSRCSIDTIDGLTERFDLDSRWASVKRKLETSLDEMESCHLENE